MAVKPLSVLWEEIDRDVLGRGYGAMSNLDVANSINQVDREREPDPIGPRLLLDRYVGTEVASIFADPDRRAMHHALMDLTGSPDGLRLVNEDGSQNDAVAEYFKASLDSPLANSQTFKNIQGAVDAETRFQGNPLGSAQWSRAAELAAANGVGTGGLVTEAAVRRARDEQPYDPNVITPT